MNPVGANNQNRSLGDEQLDDSIVDTLVSNDTRYSGELKFKWRQRCVVVARGLPALSAIEFNLGTSALIFPKIFS